MPKITFYPDNREIEVERGENLLRAAMLAGVHINAPCGGDGTCGKCRVVVDDGEVAFGPAVRLTAEELKDGYRLACTSVVEDDLIVRVPVESRLGDRKTLEREAPVPAHGGLLATKELLELVKDWRLDPPTRRLFVELSPPTLEDNVSDLERLKHQMACEHGIDDFEVGLPVLRRLGSELRAGDWKVTATLLRDSFGPKLVRVDAGRRDQNLGIAIDIGTTTVAAELVDLSTGEVLGRASDYNAQVSCGEDVISRIIYSTKGENLARLQKLVTGTANRLIGELLEQSGRERGDITHVVASGNTTMTQLFLGVSPKHIREEPYIPAVNFPPLVTAGELGIELDAGVCVQLVPGRASYVGGDITAGILGSGMFKSDKLTLYIDIGTNGEIVLGNSEWLLACSCSAGPAFEGGAIRHGMRAARGAIEQVRISRDTYEPMILTIGNARPKGICGSGLIDAVAELFLSGVIDEKGKFDISLGTRRIRSNGHGAEYVLVWAENAQTDKDIVVTEADLDNLIRAKAAIYAGISTLLEAVETPLSAVEEVLIAGAFGRYLELDEATIIGLLPEVAFEKVKFVGNGSLLGSRLVLLSKEMGRLANEVAKKMTYLELSMDRAFMDRYVSALFLPHTDVGAFPRVAELKGRERARNGGISSS